MPHLSMANSNFKPPAVAEIVRDKVFSIGNY